MAKTVEKVNNTSSNSSAVGNVSNINIEGITEVDMNRFADLSYLDIPSYMMRDYKKGNLTLKDLCEHYLKPENAAKLYPDQPERQKYILETLDKFQKEPYADFKIVKYVNNNKGSGSKATGLVAYTIEVTPGEVITAFRGSEKHINEVGDTSFFEKWKDWTDNAKLVGGITPQQQDAIDYMNDLFENGYKVDGVIRKPEKVVPTGHSKGGNNAQIVTIAIDKKYIDKIIECYSFNAPGHSSTILEKYSTQISKYGHKIKNYKYEYDLVSRLLTPIGEVIYIESKTEKWYKPFSVEHYLHAGKIDHNGDTFVRQDISLIDLGLKFTKGSLNIAKAGLTPGFNPDKLLDVLKDGTVDIMNYLTPENNDNKDVEKIKIPSINISGSINSIINELETTIKSSYKSSSKIMVNIDEIEQYIYIYDKEIDNIQNVLSSIEKSMNLLMRDAWSGRSKNNFYQRKYIVCKTQIEKCINQMEETKDFLKQCKYSFEDLKAQENSIVRSFSI